MEGTRTNRGNFLGLIGVGTMGTVLVYCFLPYSVRPTPPIFILIVWAGALASAVLAIVAGCRTSRAWFLFVLLPVAFFFMTLNFEQSTEVKLTGHAGSTTFELSGSGKLTELVVFSPEYATAAQEVHDPKFVLWSIQPIDHMSWGEPVWIIRSIRYGVVPEGYIQSFPENGHPAPLMDSDRPYLLSITTANAAGTADTSLWLLGSRNGQKIHPKGHVSQHRTTNGYVSRVCTEFALQVKPSARDIHDFQLAVSP